MVIVSEQNNTYRKKNQEFWSEKPFICCFFLQLGDTIIEVSVAASCGCRDYVKWWLLFHVLPGQGAFLQLCRSSGCGCVGVAVLQVTQYWYKQDFCADIRPGGFLFDISCCGIPGQVRLASATGGCLTPRAGLCWWPETQSRRRVFETVPGQSQCPGGPGCVCPVIPRLLMVLHCSFCSWTCHRRKPQEVGEEGFGCQELGRDQLKEPSGPQGALWLHQRSLMGVAALVFGPRVWLQPNPGCGLEPSWALIPWRTLVAGLKVSIWCISWQCASYGPFTAPWLQFWIWDVHAWRGGWWRTRTTLSHPGHCTSVTVIYSWDPVSVLKDLFFRINITLWFLISTLWNFLFHNGQTAFKFSV